APRVLRQRLNTKAPLSTWFNQCSGLKSHPFGTQPHPAEMQRQVVSSPQISQESRFGSQVFVQKCTPGAKFWAQIRPEPEGQSSCTLQNLPIHFELPRSSGFPQTVAGSTLAVLVSLSAGR